MMEFIKTKEGIFEIISIVENWFARIYDYPKEYMHKGHDGKLSHDILAENEEQARELIDDSYKEYSDKEICLRSIDIELKSIITNNISHKHLKSREEKDDFLKANIDFSDSDRDVIFRYKELLQKEQQHNESLRTKRESARDIQYSINSAAGLPMDFC